MNHLLRGLKMKTAIVLLVAIFVLGCTTGLLAEEPVREEIGLHIYDWYDDETVVANSVTLYLQSEVCAVIRTAVSYGGDRWLLTHQLEPTFGGSSMAIQSQTPPWGASLVTRSHLTFPRLETPFDFEAFKARIDGFIEREQSLGTLGQLEVFDVSLVLSFPDDESLGPHIAQVHRTGFLLDTRLGPAAPVRLWWI